MKFKSVKKSSEVVLAGIKADLDIVDGVVKGITLTDAKGSIVRVCERAYNMYVEIPAPPETEKKHKLSGTVLGLPVEKLYDHDFQANDEKRRLSGAVIDAELTVEEVQVPVDAEPSAKPAADCPF